MRPVKIAVVGCGAAASRLYLPLLEDVPAAEPVLLVDVVRARAERLARDHDVPEVGETFDAVVGRADAAILCLPHHLHAAAATELLEAGVHVLVEKPMALDVAECDAMIAAADGGGAVLAVGLVRRLYPVSRFVHDLVGEPALGRPRRFVWEEGSVFDWPVESDAMFRRESAGGGVLMDLGVHVLDLLAWWFGTPASLDYSDDGRGGVEAECRIALGFPGGPEGRVRLSRLRPLGNRCRLEFEGGSVEFDVAPSAAAPEVRLRLAPGAPDRPELRGRVHEPGGEEDAPGTAMRRQVEGFLGAVVGHREPAVTGREGRRSVELIERCYRRRTELVHPWESPSESRPSVAEEARPVGCA